MAATTGHSINTGPYGENAELYSSLRYLIKNQKYNCFQVMFISNKDNISSP
jgi:hypothetical protein